MPEDKVDAELKGLATRFDEAAKAEDPGAALRAVVQPLYDEHQGHKSLVDGCPFCMGVIT